MADRDFLTETRRLLALAEGQTRSGDPGGAAETLRSVAARHPAVSVGWLQAAVAARAAGRTESAKGLVRRALMLEPTLAPAAPVLVGLTAGDPVGERHRAAAIWAILRPESAEAAATLAGTHQQAGRDRAALRAARRALSLDPALGWVRANLAVMLRELGDRDAAMTELRRAAILDPGTGLPWRRLGGLLEIASDLTQAELTLRRALLIDDGDHAASALLAIAERRLGRPQHALARLEALPERLTGELGRDTVEFELGALRDRLGQPEAAYAHFTRANAAAVSRAEPGMADPASYLATVAGFEAAMDPAWLSRWERLKKAEAPVIFMVGFPRSGTTLLDQILDAHPDVHVIEEHPVLAGVGAGFAANPAGIAERLSEMSDAQADRLRQALETRVARWGGETLPRVVIDKMPLNTVFLPLALRLYPDAKIILSLRHPCDCCLSCFMQPIRLTPAMASFTSMDEATALYARVMGLWRQVAERLTPTHETVRYEDLIEDVEGTARRVLDFLDLDWDPAVLDHTAHARTRGLIRTPSFRQVSEPIYRRAKGRWERYRPQIDPYLDRLRPFIAEFGYDDPE